MDLWIMNQDKEELNKISTRLFLRKISNSKYAITNDLCIEDGFIDLGYYETKERALEVLQEIKRHIAFLNVEMVAGRFGELDFEDIVFEMPEK